MVQEGLLPYDLLQYQAAIETILVYLRICFSRNGQAALTKVHQIALLAGDFSAAVWS